MSLFGKIVKLTVNVTVGLPVAIIADIVTMGNVSNPTEPCHTAQALETIKREADELPPSRTIGDYELR